VWLREFRVKKNLSLLRSLRSSKHKWWLYRTKTSIHECRKEYFPGRHWGIFQKFFRGGKGGEICFFPLKIKKQPFLLKISKSRGGKATPAPLPTPMSIVLFNFDYSNLFKDNSMLNFSFSLTVVVKLNSHPIHNAIPTQVNHKFGLRQTTFSITVRI